VNKLIHQLDYFIENFKRRRIVSKSCWRPHLKFDENMLPLEEDHLMNRKGTPRSNRPVRPICSV